MSAITAGAIIGGASGLYSIYKGIKQESDAGKIKSSPYARAQLAKAEEEYNGSMPWAVTQAQNIAAAQNNANAQAARGATNGGQLLALAQLGQGRANDAYANLGVEEQQYHEHMLDNLNKAYAANVNADYTAENEKAAMEGAGAQNIFNGINGAGNAAVAYGTYIGNSGSNNAIPGGFDPNLPFSGQAPKLDTVTAYKPTQLTGGVDMSRIPSSWLFNL